MGGELSFTLRGVEKVSLVAGEGGGNGGGENSESRAFII